MWVLANIILRRVTFAMLHLFNVVKLCYCLSKRDEWPIVRERYVRWAGRENEYEEKSGRGIWE